MVSVDNLAEEIVKQMMAYSDEVDELMQQEIDKVAKEAVDSLKANPNIPKRTGKYKKSFAIKKLAQGSGYKRVAVFNKVHQLTHLLEFGHALKNGGRARAYPHWQDAQKLAEELPERIKAVLEK